MEFMGFNLTRTKTKYMYVLLVIARTMMIVKSL